MKGLSAVSSQQVNYALIIELNQQVIKNTTGSFLADFIKYPEPHIVGRTRDPQTCIVPCMLQEMPQKDQSDLA